MKAFLVIVLLLLPIVCLADNSTLDTSAEDCPNGGKSYPMLRYGESLVFKHTNKPNSTAMAAGGSVTKATIDFVHRGIGKFIRRIRLELPDCVLERATEDSECKVLTARAFVKYGRRGEEQQAYDIPDPTHTINLRIWLRDAKQGIFDWKFGERFLENFLPFSDLLYVEDKLCILTTNIDLPTIVKHADQKSDD